jgi:hypothetical protein
LWIKDLNKEILVEFTGKESQEYLPGEEETAEPEQKCKGVV